ncbi:unknown protein [Seminavis robusta]|uniref:Uncharacterized protein n=1 Tax=Seminavis robusta TaxID=568900 RepID=A0A9N8EBH0_9STRA|nr:unknown protein [Seminavis robusta]|eukprot:Sro768_g199580.1 n/a (479) ;mRNA; r:2908-4344
MSLTKSPTDPASFSFSDLDADALAQEMAELDAGPAERFYKKNGEKAVDLMAMGIGLKTSDFREVGNTDEEPYASMKFRKKVVPTQKHLTDEIKRRCIVDKPNEKHPSPRNWDKKKCMAWLQANPVGNGSDRAFIIAEERKLYDLVLKAQNEKDEKEKERASPWNYTEPYIRLIECMLDESIRDKFTNMNDIGGRDELDARNSVERPENVYEACARLFNDDGKVVLSRVLPELHSTFSECLDCSFHKMPGKVTPEDVKRRWGDCRAKLIKMISRWELSGNGFGQRHQGDDDFGHMDDDVMECGDNRANFMDSQTKEHILYLWHVADQEEILKNVLHVIAESSCADSETCPSVSTTDAVTASSRKRRADERQLAFFRAKMGLAMTCMSRAALVKELRETQDKEMEYTIKLLDTTEGSKIHEIYLGRIATLSEQIEIIQDTIHQMAKEAMEEEDSADKPSRKKKKKKGTIVEQQEEVEEGD